MAMMSRRVWRQVASHTDISRDGTCEQTAFSIWECGPTCGCPPSCTNRVIQHGRSSSTKIDLFKTADKGWGVRARSHLKKGTFIGVYSGEVVSDSEGERRGHLYNDVGRTYLFDLDGYQIRNPPDLDKLREVDPRLAELARRAKEKAEAAWEGEEEEPGYNAYCGGSQPEIWLV
jgi:histone-lysine N-methyltransferase SUV39H